MGNSGICLKLLQIPVLETLITRLAEIIIQRDYLNIVMTGWSTELTRIIIKRHQQIDGEVIQEFYDALSGLVDYAIQEDSGIKEDQNEILEEYVITAQKCLNTISKHLNLNN